MADNNYRSYRSRAVGAARESDPIVPERASDPLAELARIIGRSDPPYGQAARTAPSDEQPQAVEDSSADWAREEYAERDRQDEYYDSPPSADAEYASDSAPDYHPESYVPDPRDDRGLGYDQAPRAPVRSSRESPAWLSSMREEADAHHGADVPEHDEQHPIPADRLPALADAAVEDQYDGEEQAEHGHEGDRAYGAEDYYDEPPATRRRGGLIVVMAVLGLAVLGTAGAFAYRAMFGASVLPTLPPIIKAGNTPNKIMPSYGDAQASNTSTPKSANASAGGTEKLVSREEQPIDIQETPRTAPRVVSTIPIAPGGNPLPPGAAAATAPTGLSPAPASPWPGPTAAAPSPPAAAAPTQAPNAPVASEPKKIHTVTIRADSGGDAAAAPPAASATRTAPRANMSAAKPSTAAPADGGNQPLAIVPNAEASSQSSNRMRTAVARAPASGTTSSAAASGGYAVQLSSQRSQAEAQAVFRSLQAKFPSQLGGREPIVRRADLGSKGVYYRTLVGPFASMEEAASMCSSLKAAGGTCIVQRN